MHSEPPIEKNQYVQIGIDEGTLDGDLFIPKNEKGLIIFAHGSGSNRQSPRNQYVAKIMNDKGFGALLIDLLTKSEQQIDEVTRHLRFDIPLIGSRLVRATDWFF